MASEFDAVRNRKKQGADAKARVLARASNPNVGGGNAESEFAAVRNRTADISPPTLLDNVKSALTSPGVKDFVNKGLNYAGQEMQRQAAEREKNRLKLPPSLIIGPGFIENSTFAQATQGNRDAIGTYRAATGQTIKPLSAYEQWMEGIDKDVERFPAIAPVKPLAQGIAGLVLDNKPGQFTTRTFGQIGSAVTGDKPYYDVTTGNATADKVADITGGIGGIAALAINPAAPGIQGQNLITGPLAAAEAGLATRAGNALTNTISRQAARIPGVSAGTAERFTRGALSGAAAGAVGNTAIGINQDQTSGQEMLHNAGLGAAFGAGGDLLIRGVGAGISRGRTRGATLPEETLALPLGRGDQRMAQAGQRSSLARGDDAIVNPTDWKPEPLGLPAGRNSTFIGEAPIPAQRVGARPGTSREPVQRVSESSINRQQNFNINDPAVPEFMRVRQARLDAANAKVAKVEQQRITPEVEAEEIVRTIQQPRVRDRVYNYLDEAEKAARERIQKRKNNLNSNPLPEWKDWSIIGAAKMGKGTIKFADWTEEMVKEVGENFRPHAEKTYRAAKEELRKQERLATKEGETAVKFNSQDIGDADTFAAKISNKASKRRTNFSQKIEKIRSQFEDDVISLAGLEKRVTGRVASAEDSLYKKARLYKGAPEKAHQIVKQRLGPVITAAEKAGYTSDDLGRYALAVHAKDVNAAGYKSGFTNKEIEEVISKYEGSEEMETARKALVQVGKDMMKELVDSGVVSKELASVLDNRWENYIPLFRAFDDTPEAFAGGLSKSLANVASPVKALKGSEKKVVDPLENMVRNIFQTVNAAERNRVATEISKLAKIDTDGNFIRKLKKSEQVGRKNVVNVKEDGKSVKYEVEPEVYRALMNLDKESSTMMMNILSKPASLLRAGATLTPEFSLRNPMRDILQAYVVSKSGFNPITDFGAGLIQSISKGKLYQEWIENLGAYGNVLSMDRNIHRKALESVLKEKPSKKFVNVVTGKAFINMLRTITDVTESATKVGEYRAALRKGATPQEAAYRARDLMDFARAGSGIRQANRIVAFLNANIQGKSKLIRAIKENPMGTTARMISGVTIPTVGFFISNHYLANETQRQTIDDAADWMKDTFWLWAVPNTDVVARIPKPFDIAPIFANLPERALKFAYENDREAFDGFAKRALKDAAVPAQITALWPFIEGMANYSFFREGPIIPQREQGLKYKDQYDPVRTTETAKFLAGISSAVTGDEGPLKNFSSPRIMDNTIQGLTAGLGNYATSAIDSMLKGVGLVDRPDAPEKRLEQLPFAKAFLVDPLQSTKSSEKLYDLKDKLSSDKASAKLNKEDFSRKRDLKTLEKAAKKLSGINADIREIEKDKTMSAREKRVRIEPLLSERNQIARDTMKGFPK
ncbi:LPD38 domain-containing protein [Paenibacillus polymyxa]|uniref:LPD38 domain-containing protein n=1 Tax=Paenibacillus polymyxa TaxID=1406 RepID=UPI0004233159|nr:LPD38 domain-containing protein [Paenibacillus polymyxa]